MGRSLRVAEGGLIDRAPNRANARLTLFDDEDDDDAFERVRAEAVERHAMRRLASCVMPNHFHLVLGPHPHGGLSPSTRGLTPTHTPRWHAHHQSSR